MQQYPAKVTRVIDGDTIIINLQGQILGIQFEIKDVYLRILDINAPEIKGESKPEGLKSKEFLEHLILGESVVVESEKKDSFGRWLAHVYYRNYSISQLMLEKGFAIPYS